MFPRISADLLSRVGGHMYPLNFERQPYFDSFCSVWKRESSMKFGQEFRDHLFSSYAKFLEKYDHFLSPAYVHLRVRIRVGRYVCFSDNLAYVLMENC